MFNIKQKYKSIAKTDKILSMNLIGSTTCLIYKRLKSYVLGIPVWMNFYRNLLTTVIWNRNKKAKGSWRRWLVLFLDWYLYPSSYT